MDHESVIFIIVEKVIDCSFAVMKAVSVCACEQLKGNRLMLWEAAGGDFFLRRLSS